MNLTFSYRKEKTASNLQINEQILHVFCLSSSDLVVSKRLPKDSSSAGGRKGKIRYDIPIYDERTNEPEHGLLRLFSIALRL